ncbi:serine hydrolase domain-containing protein [Streptomyces albus subsp. chlorinus]|uniref:serine hydrolase domain-containing protein n=1 Tax=Streptomyces albus TaxID=1888 RepID=UPI00156D6C83|nr:serine hydrolase domain-containing protein [Streptomyces albus]
MRFVRSLSACLLAAAAAGAPAVPAAAADDSPTGVQRDLDRLVRSGAVGAQVRVTGKDGTWLGRAGKATAGGEAPVPLGGRFRIGSATKMFTAVTLLQLVGEGRVALDAPVARYLPPGLLPQGDRITVRMVLQHTAGLHDIARDLPQGKEFVRRRFRHHDTEEQVRKAAAKPVDFPPGTGYRYSNTNYLVAGLIIAHVTGRPYADEVRDRIIRPLGMRHTFVPGDRARIRGPHAHGYMARTDISTLNPSFAGPAGEIVSTPGDLDRLLKALTRGKLLRPAEWRQMNRTITTGAPGARYGLGLKVQKLSCGRTAIGHTGGIPGYATLAFTTREGGRSVVLSANLADWPADERIGEPIDDVLDDALCE